MAEQIIVLMADWDDETQKALGAIYEDLQKEGFTGKQTPGIPYHISMSTYPIDKEAEALEAMKKAAEACSKFEVSISHLGMFAGGSILFAAPDRNAELEKLHSFCDIGLPQEFAWTPHTTIMIDEPDVIHSAHRNDKETAPLRVLADQGDRGDRTYGGGLKARPLFVMGSGGGALFEGVTKSVTKSADKVTQNDNMSLIC